jgi:hypothetical protein
MRLWTLHPEYLDAVGLVALWREALLARAVLRGRTRGYRKHPQLERFRNARDPVAAINTYLAVVHAEALKRGYRFDGRKSRGPRSPAKLPATRGQLAFEWSHLLRKLRNRSPGRYPRSRHGGQPRATRFVIRRGGVARWERAGPANADE